MKLEIGKYYRTRDWRKVGPMRDDWPYESTFKWHTDDGYLSGMLWDENGVRYYGDGVDAEDLIAEWTDEPTTGTLSELNVKPGDVVEWIGFEDIGHLRADYLHDGVIIFKDTDGSPYVFGDSDKFRIISRASDISKMDYTPINVEKPIYDIEPDTRPLEHFQSGPVITETVKRIVPGVYGKVSVGFDDGEWCIDLTHGLHGRDELTAAIETLTAIRDAMDG